MRDAGVAPEPPLRIAPLVAEHARGTFACGVPALDPYLHTQAGQDMAKRVAVAFVLTSPPSLEVLGFYTLAAASIRLQELPPAVAKRLPKYPYVPATLLGRLALDGRQRGRGLGGLLLIDALRRSLDATRTVASAVVLVEAKDDVVSRFYAGHGFLPLPEQPRRLFLPMRTIEATTGGAGAA